MGGVQNFKLQRGPHFLPLQNFSSLQRSLFLLGFGRSVKSEQTESRKLGLHRQRSGGQVAAFTTNSLFRTPSLPRPLTPAPCSMEPSECRATAGSASLQPLRRYNSLSSLPIPMPWPSMPGVALRKFVRFASCAASVAARGTSPQSYFALTSSTCSVSKVPTAM